MAHDTFTEKLSLWLDNELGPAEVTQLQAHLNECAECSRVYQAMQRFDSMFRVAATHMVEPQTGFSARFEARLVQQQQAKRWQTWAGVAVLLVGSVAMAMLLAIAGLLLLGLNPNSLNLWLVYYWLGTLGEVVNQARACVNIGSALAWVIFITMKQPFFWGYVAVALMMTGLWAWIMRLTYQRHMPVTLQLFI